MWGEGVWALGLEGGEQGVCKAFGVKSDRLEPWAGALQGGDTSHQGSPLGGTQWDQAQPSAWPTEGS